MPNIGVNAADATFPNAARRQLLKERQHIPPLQLTAKNHIAIRINAADLKNRLRDIETDGRNRSHDLAPPNQAPNSTHIHSALAPVEEPSTASIPDFTTTIICNAG